MSANFAQLDHGFNQNADLWAAGAVSVWPFILHCISVNGGVASKASLAPVMMARFYDIDADKYERAFKALDADGTLVKVEGGWTTKSYARRHKKAKSGAERQKEYRERKSNESDETLRNAVTPLRVTPNKKEEETSKKKKQVKSESPSAGQPADTLSLELPGIEKPKKPTAADERRAERDEVFDYWAEKTGINVKGTRSAKRNKKRNALIATCLADGYTVAELKRAVDALVASPNHNGAKDGRVYLDVRYALGDNLDGWLASPLPAASAPAKVVAPVGGTVGVDSAAAAAFDSIAAPS